VSRVARAVTTLSSAGAATNLTAVDAGLQESVAFSGRAFLDVNNGSGGSITVTIPDPILIDGQAAPSRVVTITAGQRQRIGLQSGVYLQADGTTWIYYSASASVTAEACQV